jgi:hypothetical protein
LTSARRGFDASQFVAVDAAPAKVMECTYCCQFERAHDYLLSLKDGLLPFISSTLQLAALMTQYL